MTDFSPEPVRRRPRVAWRSNGTPPHPPPAQRFSGRRVGYLGATRHLLLLCAAAGAITSASASGTTSITNPYECIARRNLFGLRTPTPAQKPQTPAEPLPNIVLTGITTILGDKRAFLEITPVAKSPQPAQKQECALAEGQREGKVEVLEIDPKAGSVKISNSGTVTTLTFERNGRHTPSTPPPASAPQSPVRRFPFRIAGH